MGRNRNWNKVKLQSRRKEIRSQVASRKKANGRQQAESKRIKRRKLRDAHVQASTQSLYGKHHKILLVGEGDFSFTAALLTQWAKHDANRNLKPELVGLNVVSTCYDDKHQLYTKYPGVKDTIKIVRHEGVTVLPKVDCTALSTNKRVLEALEVLCAQADYSAGFDRIIFNFPHLGCGISDTQKNIALHREFIAKFIIDARHLLNDQGQLHITLKKGEPYDSWGIPKLAVASNLYIVRNSLEFFPSIYEGYQHRRTLGAASKSAKEGGPEANADITKEGALTYILAVKVEEELEEEDEEAERVSK